MSIQGGQNLGKDGGAHATTHDSCVFIVDNDFEDNLSEQTFESPPDKCIEEENHIQDGGHESDIRKPTHSNERLCILPMAMPMDGLSMDCQNNISDTLNTNDPNVDTIKDFHEKIFVDDNSEWIKSRCSNLCQITELDMNNTVTEGLNVKIKDITEFFQSDIDSNVNHSTGGSSPGSTSDSRATPISVDSSINSNISVLIDPTSSDIMGHGSQSLSTITKTRSDSLNPQDQACLDELERGSQLNQEEKEMIENSRKELQALEFRSLLHDRSNTLMTAQELENMPDEGLEFEESVGPKENSQIDGLNIQNQSDFDSFMANVFNNALANVDNSVSNNSSGSNVISNENGEVCMTTDSVANPDSNCPPQPTLATIAIATDQTNNSTQITINTDQGQRVYHINTTNLAQATSAIGAMGSAQVDASNAKGENAGLRIQDGENQWEYENKKC